MHSEPPKVTGLSPVEGAPGTKVTIRGENLGRNQLDIISLEICGVDCTMYAEWHSSHKIVCRTRYCVDVGEVIVTTHSGGRGSCMVNFRGTAETIGPTIESAIWVDESAFFRNVTGPTSPSHLHQENPLDLTDDPPARRMPEDELNRLFPDASSNLMAENFTPKRFLLEKYSKTSYVDLKMGLRNLQGKIGVQHEGPSSFLKSNVNAIVMCLDVLQVLQNVMAKDKQEMGEQLTYKLLCCLEATKQESAAIFDSILARKDQADSTRNALGILHKFRFLFNLPAAIERNVQKGDYDVVISDYSRAKSLFQNTDVTVFKKVFQDVEQRVSKFCSILQENLKQLPVPLDEQKRLIKYLVNLEVPGNPAWEAIQFNYDWFSESLDACKRKHHQIAAHSHKVDGVPVLNGTGTDDLDEEDEATPSQILFVQEVTSQFQRHFPDLWKLGQAYISGDLSGESPPQTQVTSFNEMIEHLVSKLCSEIQTALLPASHHANKMVSNGNLVGGRPATSGWPLRSDGTGTTVSQLGPWLPQCLRSIRQCFLVMIKLDVPEEICAKVQQLIFNLRVHSMICLLTQAAEDVRLLLRRELWRVEQNDLSGGTTQLPLMFENRVIEALQLVRENVLRSGPKETEVFTQINVQAIMKQQVLNLLQAFAEALERCALSPDRLLGIPGGAEDFVVPLQQHGVRAPLRREDSLTTPPLEYRLLVVLSNIGYTHRIVLPRLHESFKRHLYPDLTPVIKSSQTSLAELDRKLFKKLSEIMCDPVVGSIETNMYAMAFDWDRCTKPTGVSTYVKEIVMSMIDVHARVFGVSPPMVGRVFTPLIHGVAEELSRLFDCVPHFNRYGNKQGTLDIRALEEAIEVYKTLQSGKYFNMCRAKLYPVTDPQDKELIEDLLRQFRCRMRLQLLCFKETTVICV